MLAFVFVFSFISGAVALASFSAQAPSGATSFGADAIGLSSYGQTTCAADTTCTSNAIAVVANSAVLIGVTSHGAVLPSSVTASSGTPAVLESSATVAPVETIWGVVYTSAVPSLTVTVNFVVSTNYFIDVVDLANTVITSTFSNGASTASGSSATAICEPSTQYVNEEIYMLVGVETTPQASVTPGTGMSQVDFSAAGLANVVQESQIGVDNTTGEYTASATLASSAGWQTACVGLLPATVPSAPTSLAAGSITATTIPLTWTNYLSQAPGWVTAATVYWSTDVGSCGPFHSSASSSSPFHSYTITSLTPGAFYCIEVTDSNSTGASVASTILSGVQTLSPPASPTGLTAAPQPSSTSQVNLAWTAPSGGGQTSYTLKRYSGSSCGGGATTTTGIDPSALTYLVGSLSAGTSYSFTLTAVNANGNSVPSGCAATTTFAIPSAPTHLTASSEGLYNVTLEWQNPVPGAGLYNDTVFVNVTSGCTGTFRGISVGVNESFDVVGLDPYVTYCFYVTAWSGAGPSPYSYAAGLDLNVTTLAGLPAAPSSFAESAVSATTVTFIWTNPPPSTGMFTNVTAYFNAGGSCGAVNTGPQGNQGTWTHYLSTNGVVVTTYTFTGLTASTEYTFSVALWTQGGQGPQATCVTFYTVAPAPGAPTFLSYVSASHVAVTLNWTQPVGSYIITDNHVAYTTVAACASGLTVVDLAGPTTTSTVGGLLSATTYYWEVSATDSGGTGPYSSCITGATQSATPPAPINLHATLIGATFVDFTWVNPIGFSLIDNLVYVYTYSSGCTGTQVLGSPFDQLGVVASAHIVGLTSSTTYCFEVTAVDAESPHSTPLVVTTGIVGPSPGLNSGNLGLVAGIGVLGAGVALGLFAIIGKRRHQDGR